MTRSKKTRSLASKVTIRTGKRKDYRRWRQENPDAVAPSQRYVDKKTQQRQAQAERKRQRQCAPPLPLHTQKLSDEQDKTKSSDNKGEH